MKKCFLDTFVMYLDVNMPEENDLIKGVKTLKKHAKENNFLDCV